MSETVSPSRPKNSDSAPTMPGAQRDSCARCEKPQGLCVCDLIKPLQLKTRVLILRHPQEPDKALGSAPLAHALLEGSVLKTGLSWRSLSAALGAETDHKRWGVLFLGTKVSTQTQPQSELELVRVLDPKGKPRAPNAEPLLGVVALDGNWRQAKALWWRNPWLLKLQRIVLQPRERSLYGGLRKEPRPESLSTLEAIGLMLSELEKRPEVYELHRSLFKEFLKRFLERKRRK